MNSWSSAPNHFEAEPSFAKDMLERTPILEGFVTVKLYPEETAASQLLKGSKNLKAKPIYVSMSNPRLCIQAETFSG